ncbi:MAG TPA: M48 family metallopeptidase [Arenimonas sp.]|uniref:M48 family metallopeptidase n=1 Tax=Arenimonas sp. TaxID=1872635 RepID=UPI002B7271AD|nr:M48 family metallopeptidase [Arenimonas sp.]HMB58087.1 M48 family metallopeptidase [Arenimonas sp.]
MKKKLLMLATVATVLATSPLLQARRQMLLVSDAQMNQMGVEAFEKLKASDKLSHDPKRIAQARCVVNALLVALPQKEATQAWEVQVFEDANPNAFALPGGKVGVNTGMFDVIASQDELAAVIGHEMAHVTSQHANERVSRQMLAGVGLDVIGAYTGSKTSPEKSKMIMGAMGLGAQIGVLLPNTRKQEAEADLKGQGFMANAGFDPAKAVTLWQHMMAASKNGAPPQILSTHPDPQNRIKALAERAPKLQANFRAAHAMGRTPRCF